MKASFHDQLVAAIVAEFPDLNTVALQQVILREMGNTVWQGYGEKGIRLEIVQMSQFCWDRVRD